MRAFVLTLFLTLAWAMPVGAELVIFDVRKNLRLSDSDPVYHDYYVNGGTELGLTPGLILTVTRRLPLYDTYQNHSVGDLQLKVAKVKIIHAQKGLAVARLQSEFTRENAPLLEDPFIMVGDMLDLSTASGEGKGEGKKGESADSGGGTSSPAPKATAAPAPAPAAPPTVKTDHPVAQISVNSVSISPKAAAAPAPVDAPKME